MKLGKYILNNPVFMAPMAGITDKAFREIVQLSGGRYTFTEMISDKALIYGNTKTIQMLDIREESEPRIVQIFGSEVKYMARAAKIAVSLGANVIDINMGCPTPKIIRNGEGAFLLKNLSLAEKIAAAVVEAVDVPVTVKMRLGWESSSIVAPELAMRLQDAGVSMITVHARTREQFYSGKADWDSIRSIKSKVSIPVIGNGDIFTPEQGRKMLDETGCDGIMIARGALGRPWLPGRTQHFLERGEIIPEPDFNEKYKILLLHFEKILSYKGESVGVKEIRKHAAWYLKGVKKAAEYRNEIMSSRNSSEIKSIFERAFVDK